MFPSTFSYGTPAEVVFGNGTARSVGDRLVPLRVQSVMIIADHGVVQAGLAEVIQQSLDAADIPWTLFADIKGEPTDVSVQSAVEAVTSSRADAIVAIGGGSALDTAKAAAAIASNGGSVLDYLHQERQVTHPGVPVVVIPTTAGTGSEVTPLAVIIDTGRQYKGGVGGMHMMPRLAICDPELTLGLPALVTANTGLDALTHCIECYANTVFNPFAKLTALEGIRVLGANVRRAVAHGGDLATRWEMLWGAHLGGLCIARAGTGDTHAFAGPLSGMFGVLHGRANAILLPHVMEFSLPGAVEAYAEVAAALGETVSGLTTLAAAERAVTAVRRLVSDCGGQQRLSEFGVREEHLEVLTRDGFARGNRATNPRIATREDVLAIYRAAL